MFLTGVESRFWCFVLNQQFPPILSKWFQGTCSNADSKFSAMCLVFSAMTVAKLSLAGVSEIVIQIDGVFQFSTKIVLTRFHKMQVAKKLAQPAGILQQTLVPLGP